MRSKQIYVLMSPDDEKDFLEFLRSKAAIEIFTGGFSPREEGLRVAGFSPEIRSYYFWNKSFPWDPRYSKSGEDHGGNYYVNNFGVAPVIGYLRENLESEQSAHGCLFWSKHAVSESLSYDATSFEKWYSLIARWIKKVSVRREYHDTMYWVLPGMDKQLVLPSNHSLQGRRP